MAATDPRGADVLRRYHAATDHRAPDLMAQYAGTLDPALRPRPTKRYPTLPPIPLPTDLPLSDRPALDAIADAGGNGGAAVDLDLVARLCRFTNGTTRRRRRGGEVVAFRAAPCTGALYHQELYLVCGELPGLAAGVYHYDPEAHALRQLRAGDVRGVLVAATGGEAVIAAPPLILVATSVFWRNAWKYAARAYRHAYWDVGTMLPNTLAVAAAAGVAARLVLAFADAAVADLLGLDLERESAIALVAVGRGAPAPASAPAAAPLRLPTEPYSAREIDFPLIREAHRATLLASGEAAADWRAAATDEPETPPAGPLIPLPLTAGALPQEPIEAVILRRGSTRRFAREPIALDALAVLLDRATRGLPSDALGTAGIPFNQAYLIANGVAGLPPGAYRYHRTGHALALLRPVPEAVARVQAARLALDQALGGDAAVDVFFLADLDRVLAARGGRGYRLAHLAAALVAGRLYLGAYALGLGATGLTFYDDETAHFFAPDAGWPIVTFLIAIGHPAPR